MYLDKMLKQLLLLNKIYYFVHVDYVLLSVLVNF